MGETSDRFALPLLAAAQAQKEITHNEALALLDGLLHAAAETATLSTPPASPEPGRAWLVGTAPTGAWAGQAGALAIWTEGGWRFVAPRDGMLVWLADVGVFAVRRGGAWRSDGWPVTALAIGARQVLAATPAVVPPPTGGATVDVEARAALGGVLTALRALGLLA